MHYLLSAYVSVYGKHFPGRINDSMGIKFILNTGNPRIKLDLENELYRSKRRMRYDHRFQQ